MRVEKETRKRTVKARIHPQCWFDTAIMTQERRVLMMEIQDCLGQVPTRHLIWVLPMIARYVEDDIRSKPVIDIELEPGRELSDYKGLEDPDHPTLLTPSEQEAKDHNEFLQNLDREKAKKNARRKK